jgi:DNA-3-methyladenine glycosylase II
VEGSATIYRKFQAIFDGCRCPAPRELSGARSRRCGQPVQPAEDPLPQDLAAKALDGSLPLAALEKMNDESVIEVLTQVKGIGRWSAEMFLIFKLHRPDVLPVDDLAIQKAIQRAYGLRELPSRKRMLKLGEPWRPYRSVASWYLWESLDKTPTLKTDTERAQQ